MSIHARGDVAVMKSDDHITIILYGDQEMAGGLRELIATRYWPTRPTLPDKAWQRLADLHAALGEALGVPSHRPTRPLAATKKGKK